MENKLFRACLFAILLSVSGSCVAKHGANEGDAGEGLVRRAMHCLLSDEYVRTSVLKYVGHKLGDVASVGIQEGSVVDPTDKTDVYNVLLFSSDGMKSVLLMVDASDNRQLKPIPNGYLLSRQDDSWSVDEGEGGYVDYAAVAKFVTQFKKNDVHSVSLYPNVAECQLAR
jgi:hypothetical protein